MIAKVFTAALLLRHTTAGGHDASKCLEDNGHGLKSDSDCRDCTVPPRQACADGHVKTSYQDSGRCTKILCTPSDPEYWLMPGSVHLTGAWIQGGEVPARLVTEVDTNVYVAGVVQGKWLKMVKFVLTGSFTHLWVEAKYRDLWETPSYCKSSPRTFQANCFTGRAADQKQYNIRLAVSANPRLDDDDEKQYNIKPTESANPRLDDDDDDDDEKQYNIKPTKSANPRLDDDDEREKKDRFVRACFECFLRFYFCPPECGRPTSGNHGNW